MESINLPDKGNARKINRTKTGDIFSDNIYNRTHEDNPSAIAKQSEIFTVNF